MKRICDKTQVEIALNSGKYPVLYIDMDEHCGKWNILSKGCKCRLAFPEIGPDCNCRCYLMATDTSFYLHQTATSIANEYQRSDIVEMAQWAHTPKVHIGQKVILVEDHSQQYMCSVRMMRVVKSSDIWASVAAACLEDCSEDEEL